MPERPLPSALLFALVLAALLTPSGDAAADGAYYVVQRGDALSLLAERFDVSVDEIREWNELEGDAIQIGQRLRVTADGEGDVDAAGATPGPTYTCRPGDTLSHVARRFDMTLEQIRALNDLEDDAIRVGQVLRVEGGEHRHVIEVRRGDSLARIAAWFEVRPRDLVHWNPGLRPDRLQAGQRLVVFSDVPPSRSESVGQPHRGALLHPVRLPPHPAYTIRHPSKAWGTVETIRWITQAFDAVLAAHPDSPRVRVHDISSRRGGFLHGHRSHQSGRDADISYYQNRCRGRECAFRRIRPDDLDVERQWALYRQWLENDQVEAIFMDYSLQEPLYEHARRSGASRAQLSRWFQYPHGDDYPLGIVRHFRNHRDHLHVRFVCPDTDEECR